MSQLARVVELQIFFFSRLLNCVSDAKLLAEVRDFEELFGICVYKRKRFVKLKNCMSQHLNLKLVLLVIKNM